MVKVEGSGPFGKGEEGKLWQECEGEAGGIDGGVDCFVKSVVTPEEVSIGGGRVRVGGGGIAEGKGFRGVCVAGNGLGRIEEGNTGY